MAAYFTGPDADAKFPRRFYNPLSVDLQIRQGITLCWMMLPDEQRDLENVAREINRIVERVLRELQEDRNAFPPD
jgi:hypothetical protein